MCKKKGRGKAEGNQVRRKGQVNWGRRIGRVMVDSSCRI